MYYSLLDVQTGSDIRRVRFKAGVNPVYSKMSIKILALTLNFTFPPLYTDTIGGNPDSSA